MDAWWKLYGTGDMATITNSINLSKLSFVIDLKAILSK
jgi:hypothetical protein